MYEVVKNSTNIFKIQINNLGKRIKTLGQFNSFKKLKLHANARKDSAKSIPNLDTNRRMLHTNKSEYWENENYKISQLIEHNSLNKINPSHLTLGKKKTKIQPNSTSPPVRT